MRTWRLLALLVMLAGCPSRVAWTGAGVGAAVIVGGIASRNYSDEGSALVASVGGAVLLVSAIGGVVGRFMEPDEPEHDLQREGVLRAQEVAEQQARDTQRRADARASLVKARDAALAGNCVRTKRLASEIRDIDPALHAQEVVADVTIGRCLVAL